MGGGLGVEIDLRIREGVRQALGYHKVVDLVPLTRRVGETGPRLRQEEGTAKVP